MTCNNCETNEPIDYGYGSRHFYKQQFNDFLADIGDGFHNADNLLLGLVDAAHEWYEYHETASNRYKNFITRVQELSKE